MTEHCLFCSIELVKGKGFSNSASKEHIIPREIAGGSWLTSRQLCKKCNNSLGTAVDALDRLLHPFKIDSGLKPAARVKGYAFVRYAGRTVEGKVDGAGGFQVGKRILQVDPGKSVVVAQTPEEASEIADAEIRKSQRQGKTSRTGEVFKMPAYENVTVRLQEEDIEKFKRFAAKAAVEYIAYVAGPEKALSAGLDPVRQYALNGQACPRIVVFPMIDPKEANYVYLPRARFNLRQSASAHSTSDELLVKRGEHVPGTPILLDPVHGLKLVNTSQALHFELVLFSFIIARLDMSPLCQRDFTRQDCWRPRTKEQWGTRDGVFWRWKNCFEVI
ncbi:MAG: HNH endonuclease [Dehalococcoidia bacterium]|nr:HNH endonuclease [Dehalococcoidia bacterium]